MKYSTDWNQFRLLEEEGGDGFGNGGGSSTESGGQGGQDSSGGSQGGSSRSTLLDGDPDASGDSQEAEGNQNQGSGMSQSFFKGLYDENGNLNKDNFDRLPAHLKQHKDLFSKYDTVEALMGGMGNLANLAGKKGLQPLPDDAPPEVKAERDQLMKQLNRVPDEPKGYKFERPDILDETMWNQMEVDKYAEILHKHNASPDLAGELFEAQISQAQQSTQDIQAAIDQQIAAETKELKKITGDKYNETILQAKRGIDLLGIEGLDANRGIFKDHIGVLMAAKIAELSSEDDTNLGGTSGAGGDNPRQEALSIVSGEHPKWGKAYTNPEDPMHDDAIKAKQDLDRRARKLGLL